MELVFGLIIAVVVIALIYFSRQGKGLDVNNDGKVDLEDAKKAAEIVKEEVKEVVKKSRKPRTPTAKKTATTRGRKPRKV